MDLKGGREGVLSSWRVGRNYKRNGNIWILFETGGFQGHDLEHRCLVSCLSLVGVCRACGHENRIVKLPLSCSYKLLPWGKVPDWVSGGLCCSSDMAVSLCCHNNTPWMMSWEEACGQTSSEGETAAGDNDICHSSGKTHFGEAVWVGVLAKGKQGRVWMWRSSVKPWEAKPLGGAACVGFLQDSNKGSDESPTPRQEKESLCLWESCSWRPGKSKGQKHLKTKCIIKSLT